MEYVGNATFRQASKVSVKLVRADLALRHRVMQEANTCGTVT